MFAYSEEFRKAVKDYTTFLSKKYPQKPILKLVGDRYKLTGTERAMLYRGITTEEKAGIRLEKTIYESALNHETLHIDAVNQLATIGCYLYGQVVYISFDGFLRDTAEAHSKAIGTLLPLRAVEVVMGYLAKTEIGEIQLYFDKQVNGSEQFCVKLATLLPDFILQPNIILSKNVDKELVRQEDGIICTSDSFIIERTGLKVFDLAKATLEYHFSPNFFDLKRITPDSQK